MKKITRKQLREMIDLPDTGVYVAAEDIVGYKKLNGPNYSSVIARITVPKGAKIVVSNEYSYNMKLRCSRARVDRLWSLSQSLRSQDVFVPNSFKTSGTGPKFARSMHDSSFEYRVGDVVRPGMFSEWLGGACASGIHFFVRKHYAMIY